MGTKSRESIYGSSIRGGGTAGGGPRQNPSRSPSTLLCTSFLNGIETYSNTLRVTRDMAESTLILVMGGRYASNSSRVFGRTDLDYRSRGARKPQLRAIPCMV